jgi:hypothetical protein
MPPTHGQKRAAGQGPGYVDLGRARLRAQGGLHRLPVTIQGGRARQLGKWSGKRLEGHDPSAIPLLTEFKPGLPGVGAHVQHEVDSPRRHQPGALQEVEVLRIVRNHFTARPSQHPA